MNKPFHSFQKSLCEMRVQNHWGLSSFPIFIPGIYFQFTTLLNVLSSVYIIGIFTFATSCMELRCMQTFSVMLRKQIKMWLWEIIPVRHNSRTGQTRCFMFLWGASHCQTSKWWSTVLCEEQLVHLEFSGGKWPYVCMNLDIIF